MLFVTALPMESVHPLIVHFPIALLLTAFLLDVAAVVLRQPGLHKISLWNLWLGTLGAAAAVWTGWQAAVIAKHTFEIHQVMELHRKLGIAALVLACVVLTVRLWQRDALSTRIRALTFVIMLAMAGVLVYGAHLGGRLVYEFGVGGPFGAVTPRVIDDHHTHAHD